MKPSEKDPEMEKALEEFFEMFFEQSRLESIKTDTCVVCKKQVTEDSFKDEISLKEFTISGFCQECQDKTFVEPEEDFDYFEDDWHL